MKQIESKFSQMRLKGMNRCWQALLETRRAHELSLTEGLEILLQAEEDDRRNSRFERLRKSARFRYQATLEELNYNPERKLDMLALMYDCAARVQEISDLKPSSIRLNKPYTIKIVGKGNKARIVPLMEEEIVHIKRYMIENNLLEAHSGMNPLFYNSRKEKLTRAGINSILKKYANMARIKNPSLIPEKISCHSLRHSKSMHLLQAGVNLVYIRDFLGHESVQTTEVYARADSKQKREAIEKAYVNIIKKEIPAWIGNNNLLEWLKSFN